MTTLLTVEDVTGIATRHADRWEKNLNGNLKKFNDRLADAEGDVSKVWVDSFVLDGLAEIAGNSLEIRRLRGILARHAEDNSTADEIITSLTKEGLVHIFQVASAHGSTSQASNLLNHHAASFWATLIENFQY